MVDVVSKEKRSRMMSGIRGKNTKPERQIARMLHASGLRYRLHRKDLPAKPDLVFPKYRAAVLVHGCFWHGHDCHLFRLPSTRPDFWQTKIEANRKRDAATERALVELGWRLGIVWECAMKGKSAQPAGEFLCQCAEWLGSSLPRLEVRGRQ